MFRQCGSWQTTTTHTTTKNVFRTKSINTPFSWHTISKHTHTNTRLYIVYISDNDMPHFVPLVPFSATLFRSLVVVNLIFPWPYIMPMSKTRTSKTHRIHNQPYSTIFRSAPSLQSTHWYAQTNRDRQLNSILIYIQIDGKYIHMNTKAFWWWRWRCDERLCGIICGIDTQL